MYMYRYIYRYIDIYIYTYIYMYRSIRGAYIVLGSFN